MTPRLKLKVESKEEALDALGRSQCILYLLKEIHLDEYRESLGEVETGRALDTAYELAQIAYDFVETKMEADVDGEVLS